MKKLTALYILFFFYLPVLIAQAPAFKLPAYEKVTLKNGLVIYLMEQHEVPLVNISVVLPAGAIYDGEQAGLASLAAAALEHGTKNMSKSQIEEELDFIGASLNTYASKEFAGLSVQFASKDRDKVLSIVKDVLTNPLFDAQEFEKEKQRVLVGLEQAKERPGSVIGDYFSRAIYSNHPYANPVAGRISTVQKLSANDARQFYQKYYRPNGAALAIVGDFKAKEMKAKLTALFNAWQKGAAAADPSMQPITAKPEASVLLVNKDDARETTFYIGTQGIKRSNPDYVAIEVINTILGGRFTSWLNDELRVNTGLTYGAGSRFSPLKNGGAFFISTFTATRNTEAAIDKAIEVLNRLHTKGVDEQTLTSAKNYVKGKFPPDYETSGQLAGLLTEMFWYGFDETFINNFQKNVDELTVDKANAITSKYFPKDKLQFVLIGKADEIRKIAAKYGKVKEVQIKEDL